MTRALLPGRHSPLAYPGGNPGFDPSHMAAKSIRFSGVASGANFVNILTGKRGTVAGSPVAKMLGSIGNVTNFPASSGLTFTGFPAVNDTTMTMAGIVTLDVASSYSFIITTSSDDNGFQLGLDNTGQWQIRYNATDHFFITNAPAANVPYFVAASINTVAGNINYVVLRLDTGTILSGNASVGTASAASNGSYNVGTETNGKPLLGNCACTMASASYLSVPQLLQWAQDPWSFWYPRKFDMGMVLAGLSSTAPIIVQQSFFDIVGLKRPSEFIQGPFAGVSPALSGTFATSAFFEQVKPRPQIERAPESFGTPFLPPVLETAPFFETVRPKPPVVETPPVNFLPPFVATTVVEQAFYEIVRPRPSVNFEGGPFKNVSPPLSGTFATSAFFDPVKLKAVIERLQQAFGVPFAPPVLETAPFFETVRPKPPIIDNPPVAVIPGTVVSVNFSASNWFDAIKLLKVPDRLAEAYSSAKWIQPPQSYDAWFEQLKLVKVPERLQEAFGVPFPPGQSLSSWFEAVQKLKIQGDLPFTSTGASVLNTVQYAITDWFDVVKLKQPIIDHPYDVSTPTLGVPQGGVGWPFGRSAKRWWEELEEEYREKNPQLYPPSKGKKAVAARRQVKETVKEAVAQGLIKPEKAPDLIELVVKADMAPKLEQALYYARQVQEYIDRIREEEDEEDIMLLISWSLH